MAQATDEQRQWAVDEAHARRLLRSLVDTLPVGVLVVAPNGQVTLANPAVEEILGEPAADNVFRQDGGYKLLTPSGAAQAPEAMPLHRAIRQRTVTRGREMWVRRADGQTLAILVSAAPVLDEAGGVIAAIAIFRDIDAMKRADMQRREYAQRLRFLRATDHVALTSHSVDEFLRAAFPQLRDLLPIRHACLLGFDEELTEVEALIVLAEEQSSLQKGWQAPIDAVWFLETLQRGEVYAVDDIQALDVDSTLARAHQEIGVHAFVSLPLVAQEKLIGALDLGLPERGALSPAQREIAVEACAEFALGIQQLQLYERVAHHAQFLERRLARRTAILRASEAKFRAVFTEAGIGIALIDMDGRLLEANRTLARMTDYGVDELIDRDILDLVHPDERRHYAQALQDGVGQNLGQNLDQNLDQNPEHGTEGQEAALSMSGRFMRRDGSTGWANVTISLVGRPGSPTRFAVVMMSDVSEERETQAALVQAEKLAIVGRLAASLGHEINNPLQSVIGCLGLAREVLDEGGDADEYLTIASEELRRAATIVSRLRDLNTATELDARQPTDLARLVNDVLLVTRKQLQNKGIDVLFEPPADLPTLPLAADQIKQVFLNLVLNAADVMPRGGRLEIQFAPTTEPSGVRASVIDEGPGIAPDFLPRLFEAFSTTKPDGVGIGLYVSQRIVEAHEGTLAGENGPNGGAVFHVWLPTSS